MYYSFYSWNAGTSFSNRILPRSVNFCLLFDVVGSFEEPSDTWTGSNVGIVVFIVNAGRFFDVVPVDLVRILQMICFGYQSFNFYYGVMHALIKLVLVQFVLSGARCSWFLPYFFLFFFCQVGWSWMNGRKAKCSLGSSSRSGCSGLDFMFSGLGNKFLRGIDISMTLACFRVKILKLFESRSFGEPFCLLGVSPFGHGLAHLNLLLVQHLHALIEHLKLLHWVVLFISLGRSEISSLFECRWPHDLVVASLDSIQMLTWKGPLFCYNLLNFLSGRLMNINLLFTRVNLAFHEKLA